jgi:hypothetical protein
MIFELVNSKMLIFFIRKIVYIFGAEKTITLIYNNWES